VNGAFISAAYFDLAWQLIIVIGVLNGLSRQTVPGMAEAPAAVAVRAPATGRPRMA